MTTNDGILGEIGTKVAKPKRRWTGWHFTVKTLPAPIYETVKAMTRDHALSHWQTVILALLGLQHLLTHDPTKVTEAVAWVKEKYPDGKGTTGTPWA